AKMRFCCGAQRPLLALRDTWPYREFTSASLIGHSGSSAFRLSTTTVSMSLTGSCFFSNRPFRVKRFQTIHHYSVDVAHGLVLLFGIGTRGPSIMGFEDEAEQSFSGGLAVRRTVGPSGHANSPHPSSREGHHSTARWSSSVLLLD